MMSELSGQADVERKDVLRLEQSRHCFSVRSRTAKQAVGVTGDPGKTRVPARTVLLYYRRVPHAVMRRARRETQGHPELGSAHTVPEKFLLLVILNEIEIKSKENSVVFLLKSIAFALAFAWTTSTSILPRDSLLASSLDP
jgi:hypothetical protein